MKKRNYLWLLVLILALTMTGCTSGGTDKSIADLEQQLKNKDAEISQLKQKIEDLEAGLNNSASTNLLSTAVNVVELIKSRDMTGLSQYVHPAQGLRFTPYFYIDTQADQVFTAQEVAGLLQNNQVLHWGNYDGSGDPIDLKFSNYYDLFVYDQDFANAEIIGNNVAIGKGNTTDNIAQAYPNGSFIEFHFPQIDPQYQGMDWKSLRLVFEDLNGTWYLVGVVHGQWTI